MLGELSSPDCLSINDFGSRLSANLITFRIRFDVDL